MLFNSEPLKVDLDEILAALLAADEIGCDIEATDLDIRECRVTSIQFAIERNGELIGWVINIDEINTLEFIAAKFAPVLQDKTKTIIFHNASYDVQVLALRNFHFRTKLADTMIMAWLNDEDRKRHGSYGLKQCVLKYLNYQMSSYEEARSLFGSMDEYAADDAKQTLRLYHFFKKKLSEIKLVDWFERVEMPVSRILIEAEMRGVQIDGEQLKIVKKDCYTKLAEIQEEVFKSVGYKFDIASPKQLSRVLFDELKIGIGSNGINQFSERGKNGDWSTSNEVLEAMKRAGHKLPDLLLDYRELNTRLNVFVTPLLDRFYYSPIIHPRFVQTATVSGRLASRDPNYQNLPRKGGIRKALISRPGYSILRCDYSQAELRLMAHMSNDPVMLEIYRNNGDIHKTTAESCGISRQAAKACNFGIIYRMSAKRLQAQLALQGVMISIEEAQSYIKKYFATYTNVRRYHQDIERKVKERLAENGEYGWVKTLGGRLRRLEKAFLENPELYYTAITMAINCVIQGGVSDMIKVAMVEIQRIFKEKGWLDPENNIWDAYIQGQVHDELMVECKKELAEEVKTIVIRQMEAAGEYYKIKVPMTADAKIVEHLEKD